MSADGRRRRSTLMAGECRESGAEGVLPKSDGASPDPPSFGRRLRRVALLASRPDGGAPGPVGPGGHRWTPTDRAHTAPDPARRAEHDRRRASLLAVPSFLGRAGRQRRHPEPAGLTSPRTRRPTLAKSLRVPGRGAAAAAGSRGDRGTGPGAGQRRRRLGRRRLRRGPGRASPAFWCCGGRGLPGHAADRSTAGWSWCPTRSASSPAAIPAAVLGPVPVPPHRAAVADVRHGAGPDAAPRRPPSVATVGTVCAFFGTGTRVESVGWVVLGAALAYIGWTVARPRRPRPRSRSSRGARTVARLAGSRHGSGPPLRPRGPSPRTPGTSPSVHRAPPTSSADTARRRACTGSRRSPRGPSARSGSGWGRPR